MTPHCEVCKKPIRIKFGHDDLMPHGGWCMCLSEASRKDAGGARPASDVVNHCVDCCCARSWSALGVTEYDGKSIPEHITRLRDSEALARGKIAEQMIRIAGYQASRDWAIDTLAKALGIEADKTRAVEYYARLAAERIAALEAENVRLQSQLCAAQILVNQETDHYAEWKKQHDRIAALEAERKGLAKDAELLMLDLSSAWFYGNWKAETYTEREMQEIMERQGYWPTSEPELVTRRAAIDAARSNP